MKVFVGLSGGVDSSVAAALLVREGHELTGVYMMNWAEDLPGLNCPWQEDLRDARAVAACLDIPFKVYDFQEQYRDRVVNYLVAEYRAGRTPNPDIMCNQEIKFKLFLDTALADGAEAVATGHYARMSGSRLQRSVDDAKDQTYFLYRIDPARLPTVRLPIGAYTKPRVRQLATEFNLPTAAKKDSQGICFIGPVGMRAFLSRYVETEPGPIMLRGREIGQHNGAIFYTVGQRQGLGVGGGTPFYVTGKDMATNTVFVTDNPSDLELATDRISLTDTHWHGALPESGRTYQARLRHRGELIDCTVDENHSICLAQPARAVATGQSAVLYDGELVLGGGVMEPASRLVGA